MIRTIVAAGIAVTLSLHAYGKVPSKRASSRVPPAPSPAPSPVSVHPAPPLPMLPRVSRVRVEAARDRVVVLEDVYLPRGEWESGGLDLYVAFGAPGAPIAVDARLIAEGSATVDPHAEAEGDPVTIDRAVRRTPSSQLLLGNPQMAGVVLHVKEAQLRRVYSTADAAVLRVRSLLVAPNVDATGARSVVVRLGISGGLPLTLGRIQVVSLESRPWIIRAEAVLCGSEADPWPLSVTLAGKAAGPATARRSASIAPEAAARHASDDLCVRWWASP
jgi:hypothetical protein